MPERYSTTEGLEHAERTHEAAAESSHPAIRITPLMAAILAVFAGLTSLYSSRLGERMLASQSQAVLFQTHASDAWAEYQADSLKAHLSDTAALTASGAAVKAKLAADYRTYRARQKPLRTVAVADEHKRDQATENADHTEARKLVFDTAVAFFEIAIVLASVAAMVRKPWLVVAAAVLGIAALAVATRGFIM